MKIKYIKHGKYYLIALAILGMFMLLLTVRTLGERYSMAASSVERLPIYCTDNENMEIALTINCAWGADDIPDILQILDTYGVKATFFVLGVWAEQNPEMLQMIYEKGHEIGNHSYSHKLPSKSTQSQLNEEIDKCNNVIYNIIGTMPDLYRAPSGDDTDTLLRLVESKGMYAVKWSVDSIDWKDSMSTQDIISRVTGKIKSGGIMLFHNDTNHTLEALPTIITHLQAENYSFVTVSELIYKENYSIDRDGMQYGI